MLKEKDIISEKIRSSQKEFSNLLKEKDITITPEQMNNYNLLPNSIRDKAMIHKKLQNRFNEIDRILWDKASKRYDIVLWKWVWSYDTDLIKDNLRKIREEANAK